MDFGEIYFIGACWIFIIGGIGFIIGSIISMMDIIKNDIIDSIKMRNLYGFDYSVETVIEGIILVFCCLCFIILSIILICVSIAGLLGYW